MSQYNKDLINQYVTQYPYDCFNNQWLKTILLLQEDEIEAGQSGGGGGTGFFSTIYVTSANFSNTTDCPLTSLNGFTFQVWDNDMNRYLYPTTEWQPLSGGGFRVLLAGFNASTDAHNFFIEA